MKKRQKNQATIKNINPGKNLPPTMRQTLMSNKIWGIRKLISFHSERDHEFQQDWILIVSECIKITNSTKLLGIWVDKHFE